MPFPSLLHHGTSLHNTLTLFPLSAICAASVKFSPITNWIRCRRRLAGLLEHSTHWRLCEIPFHQFAASNCTEMSSSYCCIFSSWYQFLSLPFASLFFLIAAKASSNMHFFFDSSSLLRDTNPIERASWFRDENCDILADIDMQTRRIVDRNDRPSVTAISLRLSGVRRSQVCCQSVCRNSRREIERTMSAWQWTVVRDTIRHAQSDNVIHFISPIHGSENTHKHTHTYARRPTHAHKYI